MAVCL